MSPLSFDVCTKLKDKGFPQLSEFELRRPNLEIMFINTKIEYCKWDGKMWYVEGGGTKAEADNFLEALAELWLNQN